MKDVETACPGDRSVLLAEPRSKSENKRPLHGPSYKPASTQIGIKIRCCRLCLFFREDSAKDTKSERVPNFKIVQSGKRQRQIVFAQKGSGSGRVRINDVAGDEEAAVGVDAHSFTRFLHRVRAERDWAALDRPRCACHAPQRLAMSLAFRLLATAVLQGHLPTQGSPARDARAAVPAAL
jgi:hypothetical protein